MDLLRQLRVSSPATLLNGFYLEKSAKLTLYLVVYMGYYKKKRENKARAGTALGQVWLPLTGALEWTACFGGAPSPLGTLRFPKAKT